MLATLFGMSMDFCWDMGNIATGSISHILLLIFVPRISGTILLYIGTCLLDAFRVL